MKNVLQIILLFAFQATFSQTVSLQEIYTKTLDEKLKSFENNGRVLGNKYLNEKGDQILKTVIFNNSEITTNGSSISIIQGADKTSLNASILNPLTGTGAYQTYLKTGVFATGKDNIFNLYSENSWKNEIGLNVGLIIKLPGSVFSVKKESEKMRKQRLLYSDSIRFNKDMHYSDKNKEIIQKRLAIKKILELRSQWYENEKKEKYRLSYNQIKDSLDSENKELVEEIKKKGLLEVSDSIENIYQKFNSLTINNIKSTIEKELYEFDKKYDVTKGYRLHWFEISGSLANASLNIPNDSILENNELITDDLEKIKNYLKGSAGGSYNYSHNRNYIIFSQLGFKANWGSYLDSNLFEATPSLQFENNDYQLINEDEETLGLYRNVNKNFSTADFSGYISVFFMEKKNIGLFLNANHNALLIKPENTYFENNYSLIAGPLFRQVDKDNNTKAVFGIEIGFENTPYDVKAKDFFIARAKIGLPFNIYNKKSGK